ncbi:MAG: serine--tRNA ligase [Caulobacterales bacterium]|nr:serine--tRNA ligase [Caulobacterales bacterium]
MHDIRAIREDPAALDAGLKTRGGEPQAEAVLALDQRLRAAVTAKQEAETARNAASKQIGKAKASGDEAEFERLRGEVARLKDVMDEQGAAEELARAELDAILETLPNLPAADVPVGPDEEANEEVRGWGEPGAFGFEVQDHVHVGEGLGLMDFEAAARMSGARFVVLKGELARLERALALFMLDLHTGEHGYQEIAPPLLVRDAALYGTGQLPKFEEDLYKSTPIDWRAVEEDAVENWIFESIFGEDERLDEVSVTEQQSREHARYLMRRAKERLASNSHYLIPTSEVSVTNLVRETILEEGELPLRYTAWTPCFRSEAGSAGRDTRGMIRLHQFQKVELVSITRPDQSDDELERMTGCAEEVLRRLELPYRVMKLSTGDMGFSARRTYDLEVWLPSQGAYREISSCSTCGDFQARRMAARYRPAPVEGQKKPRPEFVHTLNGSGVACGRALVAVLENFQQSDGSVAIPDVLRPYMGGAERIAAG